MRLSIRNALEARNVTPSYIDLSESHKNDDMFALKKNVLRVQWEPTMQSDTTSLYGQIQWNNIQPPNLQTGLGKMYIECEFDIDFTVADATAANLTKIENVFKDGLFIQDINAALYNTQVNITGQSLTGQPYIDLPIKRLYDPDFYDSSLILKKQDKNVYCTRDEGKTTEHKFSYHYECSTPLIHPFFSSENDLAGINAFTINTQYNLTQLFNFYESFSATESTVGTITPNFSGLKWRICYNQINYEKPLNDYATLLMWEAYFTEQNQGDGANKDGAADGNHISKKLFTNNVRDIPSTPICQYAVIIRRVDQILFNNNSAISIAIGSTCIPLLGIPIYRLKEIDITINSNSNAYNTQTFRDIFHCCRQAGYLGDIDELTEINKKYPPVYGFSSLQYRNIVGSANTYRFNTNNNQSFILNNSKVDFQVYYVMLQPALFIASTTGSAFVNNMGVPFSALVKSDSDIDAYIKLIEQAGYSGGSLWSWLQGLREKLKKSRFISNAAKTVSNILSNEGVKSIVNMIPNYGPSITSGMKTAEDISALS